MSAKIRPARASDIDGILALETLFPSDRLSRLALRRFMRSENAWLWVAVSQGCVVGDVILLLRRGSSAGRVYSVVVSPAARGQGLGHRLIALAERTARAQGRTRLRLEVRTHNRAARALYQSRGYQLLASLPGYYEDGSDGLRLEKALN
jgi:[ribosomal protein S18]-alanine N-acetyltransferase